MPQLLGTLEYAILSASADNASSIKKPAEGGSRPAATAHGGRVTAMPKCVLCGEFHDTPRQTKNCELRNRTRILSSPKAPEAQLMSNPKFNESDLFEAYITWKSLFEEE